MPFIRNLFAIYRTYTRPKQAKEQKKKTLSERAVKKCLALKTRDVNDGAQNDLC